MELKTVTFNQLWAEISSGIRFTEEDIALQMAASLDDPKDAGFSIIHRDRGYFIPRANIEVYFQTHAKPSAPLSKEQVISDQARRIKELEAQIAAAGRSSAHVREIDPIAEAEVPSTPYVDITAPVAVAEGRMTPEQAKAALAKDLQGKQPKPLRDITPSGKKQSPVTETPAETI